MCHNNSHVFVSPIMGRSNLIRTGVGYNSKHDIKYKGLKEANI